MKRVRYVAGAVALAPAAIGIALPVGAQAATTVGHASNNVKTVSLRHTGAVTTALDAGCTANTEFQLTQVNDKRGHGWFKYTDSYHKFCIGTVVTSLRFAITFCKTVYLDVHGNAGSTYYGSRQICGHPAANGTREWFHTSFGVHESFAEPGYVCMSSTYGSQRCEPYRDF
jgi:hypothetical protein